MDLIPVIRWRGVWKYLSPVDDAVHHPAVPDVEPGDQGYVVHRDDTVIVDQDGGLVAGDLLHPLDLMVVVGPGDVGQGVGRDVHPLQLVQLATEIIVNPSHYLGAHRVLLIKSWTRVGCLPILFYITNY